MIALALLAAHMVGDYILQTGWMAANKLNHWWPRFIHVCLYTLCFWPVLMATELDGWHTAQFLGLVWVTHFITDSRRWASDKQWCAKPIMVDQTIHITTLAVLGYSFGLGSAA